MLSRFIVFAALAASAFAQGSPEWTKPFPPFKILGNIYWVGTYDLSTYLITTPEGNILINSGLPETVPQIKSGIEKLGFKLSDTKILMATHGHWDHVAGLAELQKMTARFAPTPLRVDTSKLSAGDRQAQDHELGPHRQLADLLGLALAGRDHGEVPAIELGTEGLDRALHRLGIVRAPLGQGGVAVDPRLARPEEVEVRAVDHEDGRTAADAPPVLPWLLGGAHSSDWIWGAIRRSR